MKLGKRKKCCDVRGLASPVNRHNRQVTVDPCPEFRPVFDLNPFHSRQLVLVGAGGCPALRISSYQTHLTYLTHLPYWHDPPVGFSDVSVMRDSTGST